MFLGYKNTKKIVDIMKKCGNVSMEELYQTLSTQVVDGYPWQGTKVKILKESLQDN